MSLYFNLRFVRRGVWLTLRGTRITGEKTYWFVDGHGEMQAEKMYRYTQKGSVGRVLQQFHNNIPSVRVKWFICTGNRNQDDHVYNVSEPYLSRRDDLMGMTDAEITQYLAVRDRISAAVRMGDAA